jgi:flavin-binding protein dodecin
MVQKIIDVVGVSKDSFAKAAQDAVNRASKTVRDMRWARASEFELELDGKKVKTYRATVRIYFDVEE